LSHASPFTLVKWRTISCTNTHTPIHTYLRGTHTLRMAMVQSPPRSWAPLCAHWARTPLRPSCRT
jgi:hypothetical protein